MKAVRILLTSALTLCTTAILAMPVGDAFGARVVLDDGLNFLENGGAGFAEAALSSGSIVSGSVILEADDGLPTINVYAQYNAAQTSAFGAGLQKYKYIGPQGDVTVSGNAHGFLTGDTFTRVTLWMFRNDANDEDGLFISEQELADSFSDGSIGGFVFEGIFPKNDGDTLSQDTGGPTEFNLPVSVTLTLDTDEEFWVYAAFSVVAQGPGAVADGLTTATFDFDTADFMIIGNTSVVPIPGALVFLLSGFGMLMVRRRHYLS